MGKRINSAGILSGKICPYCNRPTEYVDSACVYGRSYGMIYRCQPCGAWVGVHKGTDKALGRLANETLRELKKQAHYFFDQIHTGGGINVLWPIYISNVTNRTKAYKWLAGQMGLSEEECHIGMFGEFQCEVAIAICKDAIEKITFRKSK